MQTPLQVSVGSSIGCYRPQGKPLGQKHWRAFHTFSISSARCQVLCYVLIIELSISFLTSLFVGFSQYPPDKVQQA